MSKFKAESLNCMPLSESDIDESVRLEKVRLLYSNIPTNILATLIGAGLFTYTQSNYTDHSLLINWVLFLLAIALVRLGLFIAYQITPKPNKRFWQHTFTITVLLTATIWSSAIFFLMPHDNIISQVILATIIMAVSAGSVSLLSYLRIPIIGFLTILMVPLIAKLLTIENEYTFYISIVYSVFFISLLVASLKFNRYITENIELKYKSINDAIKINAAKEQTELANTAKSIFLSSMSHELRTPMNAIMGFTQIMQMDQKDELSDEQAHNLKEIMSASQHLLSLIDDILDLSNLGSGEFDSSPTDIDLDDIINEAIPLIFHLMKKKNIDVSIHDDVKYLNVHADPVLLKKVLFNILCNAIEYNYEGGNVIVTAEKFDGKVNVSISDTGKGIADSDLKHLFKPFHRLDTKHNVSGVGIGLSLSKKMVEVMNGTLTVKSAIGEGSRFTITLPSADEN